ncbi:MAG: efflux RND transporter permease subunit [Legionellaceae bacterium]|nr:efflux RND transporter permease subunit [Legionellaceae bacterium]
MISEFFIERPILSNVIALMLVFLGIVAIRILPIAQYPEIVPPTIQVSTSYPGADAKTLIKTVALPIEQQVNGTENMLYMQSTSSNSGAYNLIVTFEIGTDLNLAQMLVQNRVQAALAQLPDSVQKQGVKVQQKSTAILEFITLTSKNNKYDGLFLNNYATINMQNELSRLAGVGSVVIFGSGSYAMRVWLDPKKMYTYSLNPSDVLSAIKNQNKEISAGQIGSPPMVGDAAYQLTVDVPGQLTTPAEFENIIVKTLSTKPNQTANMSSSAKVVRLRDVGRVELGSSNYNQSARLNGKPTAAIGIYQLPGANALEVSELVHKTVKKMSKKFPDGIEYSIPFNTTMFVKESVHEVYKTLFEAGILVLVVILLFLQNFRATMVPATTVPVTIIGAFIAMLALGYTINLMTLLALVLAIGIVVDDAIVIVEGVTHHIEKGTPPKAASIKAMRELIGPIIGITLVLMAVFVPAGFMPGLTGAMYAQFALVIAATAFISAINAVTLKPTQCALWLKPIDLNRKKNIVYRTFDRIYNPIEEKYTSLIDKLVHRSGSVCLIGFLLIFLSIFALTRIPTGFIPIEDQGYMVLNVVLPDGATLKRTEGVIKNLGEKVSKVGGVANVIGIDGISLLDNSANLANAGVLYVTFKSWAERGKAQDLKALYTELNEIAERTIDAKVMVIVPPPIQGLGLSGGFQLQIEVVDGSFNYQKLQDATDNIIKIANDRPEFMQLITSFRSSVPQVSAPINRTKAETLGVTLQDAFDTLQTYLGSSYVNLFSKFGQVFQVYVQAESESRMTPDDVRHFYVKNHDGSMVPLGTITDINQNLGPALISMYNLYPSSLVNGASNNGYSSGQSIKVLEEIAQKYLPEGLSFQWTSTAYQEKVAGNLSYYIFILSLLLVYFILAGQYESWILPSSIILSVPLALLGTAGILLLLGIANNMYTQIGILLLIALSAKNAILIVEVAREQRVEHNKSILEAAVIGAKTRFRPIIMTSFAFILGVMPLVLASGAGANARKSIGIAVASGMLASTCIAVVLVPSFYVLLQQWEEEREKKKNSKKAISNNLLARIERYFK